MVIYRLPTHLRLVLLVWTLRGRESGSSNGCSLYFNFNCVLVNNKIVPITLSMLQPTLPSQAHMTSTRPRQLTMPPHTTQCRSQRPTHQLARLATAKQRQRMALRVAPAVSLSRALHSDTTTQDPWASRQEVWEPPPPPPVTKPLPTLPT